MSRVRVRQCERGCRTAAVVARLATSAAASASAAAASGGLGAVAGDVAVLATVVAGLAAAAAATAAASAAAAALRAVAGDVAVLATVVAGLTAAAAAAAAATATAAAGAAALRAVPSDVACERTRRSAMRRVRERQEHEAGGCASACATSTGRRRVYDSPNSPQFCASTASGARSARSDERHSSTHTRCEQHLGRFSRKGRGGATTHVARLAAAAATAAAAAAAAARLRVRAVAGDVSCKNTRLSVRSHRSNGIFQRSLKYMGRLGRGGDGGGMWCAR